MKTQMWDGSGFLSETFRRHLFPAILSLLGIMVSTMANSIIASNLLGNEALAVMSVVSPIYFIFATVGALVGVGGSSVAAWAIGRSNVEGSHRAFTLSCLLALGIGLVLTVAGLLLLDPFVHLLGADENLFTMTRQYAFWFILGGIGTTFIYIPFNFLKLEGRLRLSMSIFLFMAAVNIGLDFFMVLVLDWGIVGISVATAVAAVTASAVGMLVLLGRGGTFRLCSVKGYWQEAWKLVMAGSPASLNNLATTARTICLNLILLPLAGKAGLGAFSIVTTAANLALAVISGAGQTTAPFIGVFTRERDNSSIRQMVRQSMTTGIAIVLPLALLLALLARPFCSIFGVTDPAVLAQAVPAVMLFAISLVPSLISTILLNYYLASGNTWLANAFTLCRAFAFVVLPALALSSVLGIAGVWLSFTVTELLSWAVLFLLLLLARRRNPACHGVLRLDLRYEEGGRYISFTVHSSEGEIVEASQRISEFCDQNELDARRSMRISLALEELLISMRSHCFAGDDSREMNVRILILPPKEGAEGDEVIILRIRCAGIPFNPVAYYENARRNNPDEFDDSVGIRMIVKSAQSVDYKSTFGVNNLTIIF